MGSKTSGVFTDNGNSAAITTRGKSLSVFGEGNFGSGTITVQVLVAGVWQPANTTLIDTLTASGQAYSKLEVPDNVEMRLNLAGATSPNVAYSLQG